MEGRHGASCSAAVAAAAAAGADILAQPLKTLQEELQPLFIQGTCSEAQGRSSGAVWCEAGLGWAGLGYVGKLRQRRQVRVPRGRGKDGRPRRQATAAAAL